MRTLHAKSSARSGSDQGYFPEKRHQTIAGAAYYCAERRGFRGGEELSDWLEAEADVEHLLESRPGNESKTSAKQASSKNSKLSSRRGMQNSMN